METVPQKDTSYCLEHTVEYMCESTKASSHIPADSKLCLYLVYKLDFVFT